MTDATFPSLRMRRWRRTESLRRLVREARLSADDLICPLFVKADGESEPVPSMPGVQRIPLADLTRRARDLGGSGIPAVALFPVIDPTLKSNDASEAVNATGLVPQAIDTIKQAAPDLLVITDVALDPYTSHGQDGLVDDQDRIVNDATVEVLAQQATVHAQAGADVVAPSDMMDGRIGAIRQALEQAALIDTIILSYAAKYASTFYGPFRDAVGSQGPLGNADKRTYQMDPANSDEALREVALDLAEGADAVMVKPGLPYLDIVCRVKQRFGVPVFAYHVSGEYAMLKAAGDAGWLDAPACLLESLMCLKRAGADAILTYAAEEVVRLLD